MSEQQVVVPDIGGGEGAEVIEVLVAVGDQIEVDQSLIVLESDKASMEIPSTASGVVTELLVKEGDELAEGAAILKVESAAGDGASEEPAAPTEPVDTGAQASAGSPEPEEASEPQSVESPEPEKAAAVAQPPVQAAAKPAATSAPEKSAEIYAGPAVRKLAREFGVPLADVTGSGPQGRVVKEDVQAFVKDRLESGGTGSGVPEVPDVDFSQFGDVEVSSRSKLDKLTASNMHRSWLNVPHVTQFDNA
ncbi:MAG: biotin/lipoyl-containing protein, partial [Halioglobus sp.]